MYRIHFWILIFSATCALISCNDEATELQEHVLSEYILLNQNLELSDLVACAGGREDGLLGTASLPTDVFFYPIQGATDFRYYETASVIDSADFSKYIQKQLTSTPMFNGYLHKFNNLPFEDERMGIVTYKTPGKLHVCNPIRLKTNTKPTEVNNAIVEVEENGITPTFKWSDGIIKENAIYFQVISDTDNNLISGTYTYDKSFTFYDLSNVVFNITDTSSTPQLDVDTEYAFTLMGVSEDNWVNLLIEKNFTTN